MSARPSLSACVFGVLLLGALVMVGCAQQAVYDEGLEVEELGTFTTDTGGVVDIPFEVPQEAVSALVYCGPYGTDRTATAASITAPSGAAIYDSADPTGTAMRVGVHSDLLPILIPVSPDLDLEVGAYTLRIAVATEERVSLTCNAVYRTEPVQAAPVVDVDLVFVGVDGIASGLTEAEGEVTMDGVLEAFEAYLGSAGISIGTVRYADFEGAVDTYTVVDGPGELGELLRFVPTTNARALTYFLVQEVTDADGAPLLGLSGGPPGTAAVGGTSKSGVVVSVASFISDPDAIARTMAHEGGHFLGLFHTTEPDGSASDPLGDTPACATDTDGNGVLATNECTGTGAENVMWWASAVGSTGLSADQGWVMARSAAVR